MATTDPAAALYHDLLDSITVHPHRIDVVRDKLLLVRLSTEDLREASFLDQRIAVANKPSSWFEWEAISRRMAGGQLRTPAHYMFHIGHCGSTLVSRLLGELGVLPLREPLALRTLADLHMDLEAPESRWSSSTFGSRLELLAGLFDRGTGPRAVKATSFCNDLALPILEPVPARTASVVYTGLRPYLANVLVGPNSQLELMSRAPMRLRRLTTAVGEHVGNLHDMSPGVVAAMSWACETTALAALTDAMDHSRLTMIDFDHFLTDPAGSLRRLADRVVPGVEDALVERAVQGPVLTRYSKAPEHAYDAGLRQRVLEESGRLFGEEIRAGVSWCEFHATRIPRIAQALRLFAGG